MRLIAWMDNWIALANGAVWSAEADLEETRKKSCRVEFDVDVMALVDSEALENPTTRSAATLCAWSRMSQRCTHERRLRVVGGDCPAMHLDSDGSNRS